MQRFYQGSNYCLFVWWVEYGAFQLLNVNILLVYYYLSCFTAALSVLDLFSSIIIHDILCKTLLDRHTGHYKQLICVTICSIKIMYLNFDKQEPTVSVKIQ